MASRSDVRRRLRAKRRSLNEEARRLAAEALIRIAVRSHFFLNADRIAFYFPADGEPDVLPLLERAYQMNKRCYLPVLDILGSNRLRFMRYKPGDRLVLNHFGIAEPRGGPRGRISSARLDLVFMPLVAFDSQGNRLGMGSGFYDRTLGFLRRRRYWHRPLCLGIAYEFQRLDRLEANPWDIPLDGCLTEHRLYRFHPVPARG